jgi:radical SAM-linked protein
MREDCPVRVLFRFEKFGVLRYISHLDLQRAMGRALNRAGLPVEYSKGFHPLPIISFAQALAVGCASRAEYMDAEMTEGDLEEYRDAFNRVLPQGLYVNRVIKVAEEKMPSLMAAVAAAEWMAFTEEDPEELKEKTETLLKQTEIVIDKRTKSGVRPTDIRGGILEMSAQDTELHMLLRAGSSFNLKPADVLSAAGIENVREIVRTEIYARDVHDRLVPFDIFYEGGLKDHGGEENHTGRCQSLPDEGGIA